MLEALNNLLIMITNAFNFLINTFTSLFNFFTKIPTFLNFIISSTQLMPPILIPFLLMAVSIYVILFIIGRN